MVDWKKDISFGRKPKPEDDPEAETTQAEAAGEPAAEKISIWKKEIGRKPKPAEPEAESGEPATEKTSIWKKEIGRKPKATAEAVEPETGEAKTPFWKKEVSLGRKAKPGADEQAALDEPLPLTAPLPGDSHDPAETDRLLSAALATHAAREQAAGEPPAAEPPPAVEPEASSTAEAQPAAEPEVAATVPEPPPPPEPEHEAEPEPEHEAEQPLSITAEPAPEPEPEPVLPPAAEAPSEPEPEPVAEAPEEPVEEREQLHPVSWVDAVLHASVAEDETGAAPPTPPVPEPALPPAAEAPQPAPATLPPPVPAAPEPVAAQPVAPLPVAETPVPEAQTVHPPVPAAELPPIPAEPKVPFWKKELGGSKKTKEPKQPKEPKAEGASTPFWKKELGGSKKTKEPKQPKEPKAEGASTPFWKKELGGSRKSKKTAGAAVATAAVALSADSENVKAKTPFWKLELGGKKKKEKAEAPAVEPVEPGAKKPLKKRSGFTMPRLELPTSTRKKSDARHKELVGLKIGASQIAAARVSNNGVAEVTQVAREEIDPGIVVGGELRDPEALAVALKEFFRDNKLPKRNIRLGIANNRIGVRTFEITGIEDPKQLANAIRFRAQEALPIPIEEAVLDYHVLSETTNEEGETVRKILLVVAYRELVDRYVSACRDAGLSLAGIDLEAFALLRSLAAPREEEGPAAAALVAVAVGHDRSTFAVSDGRVCEFTRVLDWGGSTLSVAIARALDMTPSETDPIKHAISLEPGPAPEGISEEVAAAAREAVKAQINGFARELVSSLQFYQNQPGSLGIGEIILTGGTAHLPGFAAELQRLIGVRVKLGDPLIRVKVGKRIQEPEQLGSLAIAIGLGIED